MTGTLAAKEVPCAYCDGDNGFGVNVYDTPDGSAGETFVTEKVRFAEFGWLGKVGLMAIITGTESADDWPPIKVTKVLYTFPKVPPLSPGGAKRKSKSGGMAHD